MKNHLSKPNRNRSTNKDSRFESDEFPDRKLMELVILRIAQIHQCAECIDNHTKELRSIGENKNRLEHLETWETSELFDGKERAALTLCEEVTLYPGQPSLNSLIPGMRHHFTKGELLNLTMAIMAVNDAILRSEVFVSLNS